MDVRLHREQASEFKKGGSRQLIAAGSFPRSTGNSIVRTIYFSQSPTLGLAGIHRTTSQAVVFRYVGFLFIKRGHEDLDPATRRRELAA